MNTEKTGKFITLIRGELGLTQKELANRIGVTDKAVSKWETGRGFPDVGVLEILAKELGVSVTELMNGERFEPDKIRSQADNAVMEVMQYVKRMSRKTFGVTVIIFGACLCLAPLVMTGIGLPITILGTLVILGGVYMLMSKGTNKAFKIPRLALDLISLGAIITAVVLELLPNGVIMWGSPDGVMSVSSFCSYFNPLAYGMGHFAPFITAILTVAATILTVIAIIAGSKHTKLRNALFICLTVTTVVSMCPVLYGFKHVTLIGVFITIALGISAITRAAANAKK